MLSAYTINLKKEIMGMCASEDQKKKSLRIDWNRKHEKELEEAYRHIDGHCHTDEELKEDVAQKIFNKFNKIRDDIIDKEEFLRFLQYAYNKRGQYQKAKSINLDEAEFILRSISESRQNFLTKQEFKSYIRSL